MHYYISPRAGPFSEMGKGFCRNEYLQDPKAANWPRVTTQLDRVLVDVNKSLAEVANERSELTLQPTYFDLSSTLTMRGIALQNLVNIQAPQRKEDLAALASIRDSYKQIAQELQLAIMALNSYTPTLKP